MAIYEIQKALAVRGYDPGNIDGVWGRRTSSAVRLFQTAKGLQADGIVGPKTLAALGLPDTPPKDRIDDPSLVWLSEARRLLGLKEGPGSANNPAILDWADNLKLDYRSDEIAWCGLFVAHCIGSSLTTEPLPGNPLGAREWLKFGGPCPPQPGAILVFWRVKKDGWKGHVGFYVGETAKTYLVLGGNQSDSVSIAKLDKTRLLGARWPATAPAGSGKPRKVQDNGDLVSTNEQ